MVQGAGFRVQGSEFRGQGSGFSVQVLRWRPGHGILDEASSGFRVQGACPDTQTMVALIRETCRRSSPHSGLLGIQPRVKSLWGYNPV